MSTSTALNPTLADGLAFRKHSNLTTTEDEDDKQEKKRQLEFAHSFPIHTQPSASILSKESTDGLSFRGFGNLARELR